MPNTDWRSVDDYIAAQPEGSQAKLHQVREVIRKALPKAEEIITYQIPTYKVEGKAAVFFAGWKKHYSVYPISQAVREALGDGLDGHDVNDKGTVRFPLTGRVPTRLIARIAKARAAEIAALVKAAATQKAAKKKTSKSRAKSA